MSREFTYGPAVRAALPLLLGVAGPTGSGKTYTALRVGTGVQRVCGGDIALIDTEAKRGTAYDRYFKYKHLDFQPPFGPLDYIEAIDYVIKHGAKVVIVDSATHEHSGPGGVMDQVEQFLQAKCGNDMAKRERMNMLAHKAPKDARKKLNNYIIQAGRSGVNFIFCYRADEKVKPIPGQGIQNVGMQPETTSRLVYEMMAMFLLQPASDGRPNLDPQSQQEKMLTKLPVQFRDLLKAGQQLTEELGEQLAEWAKGTPATPPEPVADLSTYRDIGDSKAAQGTKVLQEWWAGLPGEIRKQLKPVLDSEWKPLAADCDQGGSND